MSGKKNNDPFWWTLFGAGGTLSAFFIPIHVVLFGLAIPLGWVAGPDYESLLELVRHPIARIYLFALITFSLFHWAHRFRYTLYDGLQLKHLEQYIVVLCYGSAIVGTVFAAHLAFSI
ncbi:MAG: fumarate reductase subunit FrdD [Balneolaceae bacterium]|nr:fumarate reductase subunit FrdD [Balneolaceae bacterium]